MYGKVFEQIYDGTLAGHWQAIVTMQQLIVLANEDGVVDLTPEALSRRTSIPLHVINAGLDHLGKPDPLSRTPGEDGKRIVPLDDHRPWGWRLVNHAKYKALRNMEQKREADRVRIAEKRKQTKDVAIGSRGVADVAHTDADADAKKDSVASQRSPSTASQGPACPLEKLIALYHEALPTCTRMEKQTPARLALIRTRWRDESKPNRDKHPGYTSVEEGLAYWRRFFAWCAQSKFLTGRAEGRNGGAPFVASLPWLLKAENFAKVIEANYHRD